MFFVLNGNAPPNVRQPCRKLEIVLEQLLHPFGALCEDLVGVPIGDCHHLEGCDDEPIRNVIVEQIRHAVDDDSLGTGPLKRLKQLPRRETDIKSLLERPPPHESYRHTDRTTGPRPGAVPNRDHLDHRTSYSCTPYAYSCQVCPFLCYVMSMCLHDPFTKDMSDQRPILADVAPYSREYNTFRQIVGKEAQGNTDSRSSTRRSSTA